MDFVPLSAAQRRAIDSDGFLVVPQVLDADAVSLLTAASDRLMGPFLDDPEQVYLQLRQGLVQEPDLDLLVAHPKTVPLVVQLLSPNIHLHSASIIYKKPQDAALSAPARGWHRDIGIAEDLGHQGLPRLGIKVCYCLSDFSAPASGMTLLAPGSHINGTPLGIRAGEVDPPEVADIRVRAGDAVFFENRVFHSAAPNLSDRISRVIIYGYAYRWMKTDQYLDPPDPQVLQRAGSAIDFQLLGGYYNVDESPQALLDWAEEHGVNPGPVQWTAQI